MSISEHNTDEYAQRAIEQHNAAFRVLYDTVLEVEGSSCEEETLAILCRNLRRISGSSHTALASGRHGDNTLQLRCVSGEGHGETIIPVDNTRGTTVTVPDIVSAYDRQRICECTRREDCLFRGLPGVHCALQGTGTPQGKCYRLTTARDGRLIIAAALYFPPARQFAARKMTEAYLNLAEMVVQHLNDLNAARESERKYRSLVEHGHDGIVITRNKMVEYLNHRMVEIVGYTPAEAAGTCFFDYVYPEERERTREFHECLLREKDAPRVYETALWHKDGRRVLVEAHTSVIPYEGKPALITFVRDVTEREALAAQLVQAQKLEAIGQLAAGIAHEINTPTQYVGDNIAFLKESFTGLLRLHKKYHGLLEAARRGPVASELMAEVEAAEHQADMPYLAEEIPKAIEQAAEGVDRITRIVRAMNEFSHPSSEEKIPVDLNRELENTIVVCRSEWKYVAEVVTDFAPDLPLVPCLPGDMNQVFLNMIVNAAHAIAEAAGRTPANKGTITVGTRRDNDRVEVRISDTGTGIPENIRSRIFDPFFTTKDPGKGTGQGLAIAHSVVTEKHGGTIRVETETGKGAAFIISLPIENNPD